MTKNFTVFNSGTLNDWKNNEIERPGGIKVQGKKFIKDELNSTGCEISVNSLAPGKSAPFMHAHKENEEIYVFLQGRGQMQIDGETFDVGEGAIVRIAPAGMRIWRNTSETDHLLAMIIQVRENSLNQYSAGDGIRSDQAAVWPK